MNAVHQADLLFLPHDKASRGRKVFKYTLTVADVASRYKEAENHKAYIRHGRTEIHCDQAIVVRLNRTLAELSLVNVRYVYQPGELEGGVKRATDPIWSLKVYNIERLYI